MCDADTLVKLTIVTVIGSATGDNATVPHTLEKCDVSPILYASVGRRSPRHDSACPSNKAVRPTVRRALVESTRTISATISGTISSSPSRALRSSRALPEIVAEIVPELDEIRHFLRREHSRGPPQ